MKFSTTLIAVNDMEKSLAFYKEIFNQDVVCDLGWNKTLTCGLCLQLNFDKIAGFPKESMQFKTNNTEFYFETEDMDSFMKLLDSHPEIERLHELKTHTWHQRTIRFYDPDGHLIEVGESMQYVAFSQFEKGLSAEETAKEIEHPVEIVNKWFEEYKNIGKNQTL